MTAYIAKRVGWAVITVYLTTTLVFFMTAALPGDPARTMLGTSATPESIAALNSRLGLDKPLWDQYLTWLGNLVTGNLGTSAANGNSVWDLIAPRLGYSLILLAFVVLVSFPLAFGLGVLSAARRGSAFDSISNTFALVVVALPEFVVAIGAVYLLAGGVWSVLPAVSTVFDGQSLWNHPAVLVLPALTATLVVIPYMMRMVRAVMIEVLDSEYIEMARLGGLSDRRVLFRHALPNSLAPVTQVCALIVVYLFGGLVVIESVFAFPGIGSGLSAAVKARDLPQVQGIAVVLVTLSVIAYFTADLLTIAVSPRARTSL